MNVREVLNAWINQEVTIVNPESYNETIIRDLVQMETYVARITELGDDFLRLSYEAPKKKEVQAVNQVIPLAEVKRISQWGDERIIHL